ncbi:MAG: integral membrane sensor signal transduction histidine kinase [Puniceicoccaceae bacterium 5H]|nr:MAG: integral membrane sensor signal transduction histidine kinase [Puniceicoccaceae bacterium 5H]
MTKLRTKLHFAFLPLIILMAAVGIYAILLTYYLVSTVEQLEYEDIRSTNAVSELITAVNRTNAGVNLIFNGYRDEGAAVIERNRDIIEQQLDKQQASATDNEAKALTEELAEAVRTHVNLVEMILDPDESIPDSYTLRREESAQQISELGGAIIERNNASIANTFNAFEIRTETFIWITIIAIFAALLLALLLSYRISDRLVHPIEEFTEKAELIGQGDFETRVSYHSNDEIGRLAQSFNHMLDRLRAYRRLLNAEITQTRMTLETIVKNLPVAFFFYDQDAQLIITNDAADHLQNAPEWKNGMPEEVNALQRQVQESHKLYAPDQLDDALILHVHNEERFFLPTVFFVEGDRSKSGVVMMLQDVTKLRLTSDLKNDLVAIVSHELKTPLTSARLSLYMLSEEQFGDLNDVQRELVATAKDDLDRQLKTIQSLLSLSKIESGSSRLERQTFHPCDLLENSARETRQAVEEAHLELQIEAAETLPDIEGDPFRLQLVLTNFISNAIKVSPEGTSIVLRAAQQDEEVRFSVIDHGPGIAPEYRSRVFNKFFRIPEQQTKGAGLGLSIAREIALAHNGEVGCESEIGKGSEFFMILPLRWDAHSDARAQMSTPAPQK